MTRLVRIYCPSCSQVAATVDRLDVDAPWGHGYSHLIVPAGTLAIVQSIRQALFPKDKPDGKPTRRALPVVNPLAPPPGTSVLSCPRCGQAVDIDLAAAATAAKQRKDLRPERHDPRASRWQ